MKEDSRRDRRKAWCRKILSLSRRRGDKRPSTIILTEAQRRSDAISRAFNEAYHDRAKAETVVNKGRHYPCADLHEGVVLTRSFVYIDPFIGPILRVTHIDPALVRI